MNEQELKDKIQICEQKMSEYRKLEKQYRSIVDNIKEIIFQTDATGLWTFLNRPWTEITGFSIEESLGQLFLNYVHPEDRQLNQERFTPLIERKKDYCRHTIRYITKDDGFRWIEVYARLTLDEDNNIIGTSGTLNDVTERIQMEQELAKYREELEELVKSRTAKLNETNKKLKHLATHDTLTGIPNRYFLEKVLNRRKSSKKEGALLFIDIDNFKVINDTFGHTVGDQVLVQLAHKLQSMISNTDFISRLGGDEFAILLRDTDLEQAQVLAEKIRQTLDEQDICLKDYDMNFNITLSIGIVPIIGGHDLNSAKILSSADVALYTAKYSGKNRIETLHTYDQQNKIVKMNEMVTAIRDAIKNNKFILYYQPIYQIGGEITHYETLIRMVGDDNALIYPNDFIGIAEHFGVISKIDRWVIKNVLIKLKERADIKVFINLSGISLGDKALLQYIKEEIQQSGIEPSRLGFEITETTAIKDLKQSELWIMKLKEIGCSFALDDFGVGFSSFSYLGSLPIDYLKIDGSYVKNLIANPTNKALIEAMNSVAHALGKKTIAEFVENEEILETLKELGIDYGQGYHLGRPQKEI